jgi:hypothetical protein
VLVRIIQGHLSNAAAINLSDDFIHDYFSI